MSFFYYVGEPARTAQTRRHSQKIALRFGQGPSRQFKAQMMRTFALRASKAIEGFDRFLHIAIEALAASKLRRIERELQLRHVRYKNDWK